MSETVKKCLRCGTTFTTLSTYVKRGHGKFCSISCSSTHSAHLRCLKRKDNCICAECNRSFYRPPKKAAQRKKDRIFCSRTCKEAQQVVGGPLALPHYGEGQHSYRKLAFSSNPKKCNRCSYNRHPEVLQVHHVDRDRSNNSIENLEVLCPTCHFEEHFLAKDGWWIPAQDFESGPKNWPPPISPKKVAALVKRTSYSAVARKYGVVPNTVKNLLMKNGHVKNTWQL